MTHLLSVFVHSGGEILVGLVHLLHPLLDVGRVGVTLLHQGVGQLQEQLHLLPRLPRLLLEGVVLDQQLAGLLVRVADLGVGGEVDVALLLDPGQRLAGRALEQDILLVLVQPLLLAGPVFQHTVLLSQQLLQNYFKGEQVLMMLSNLQN